jgi:hypothetical protein
MAANDDYARNALRALAVAGAQVMPNWLEAEQR